MAQQPPVRRILSALPAFLIPAILGIPATLASIAVSDGAFFIRTGTHLYRIEESP